MPNEEAGREGSKERRFLCPDCASDKIVYNTHFKSWKCLKCEKSFIYPSSGVPYRGKKSKNPRRTSFHNAKKPYSKLESKQKAGKSSSRIARYSRWLKRKANSLKRTIRKTFWSGRKLTKLIIFFAVLANITALFCAVGLTISGDVSLTAGIIISVIGLVVLLLSLKAVSKYQPRITGTVMILVISAIYIVFSFAYLDIRSFTDIKESIMGAFNTEEGEFRSNLNTWIDRIELNFVQVSDDDSTDEPVGGTEPEPTSIPSNKEYVYVGGGILVGADGHRITLIENSSAVDVTWVELTSFLALDDTDKQTYSFSSFVCADFAEMLHNNAEAAGIRAAYVTIELGPNSYYSMSGGHALNAFQTTDLGLVYIDCTAPIGDYGGSADKVAHLEVGKEYIPEDIFPSGGWSWLSMGVVEEIEIVQW
jgi:ribosomal protein L37AE/L43A